MSQRYSSPRLERELFSGFWQLWRGNDLVATNIPEAELDEELELRGFTRDDVPDIT